MPKLTIIIPVYNGERFIDRCLQSIFRQTFQDYEVIIINDGSTDTSGNICDNYALQDSRIKIIHQDNVGQSMARKAGLKIAKGEYVGFVDIDDWISNDMYAHLIDIIEKNNCDIATLKSHVTNKYIEHIYRDENIEITEKEDILYRYLSNGIKNSANEYSLCNKIYRCNLFADVTFQESNYGEDYLINYRVLDKADKMVRSNKIGYFYYQRQDSTIHGRLEKKDLALLENCNKVLKTSRNTKEERIITLAELILARSCFSLLLRARMCGIGFDIEKTDIRMLQEIFHKNYLNLITSEVPFSRKVLMTMLLINNIVRIPMKRKE